MNNIYFVIVSVIVLLYVINIVRKKQFSIKESFWWFVGALIMCFGKNKKMVGSLEKLDMIIGMIT